jgi:outer membrane protein OmpA-like peptidoglycan-associated protein
MAQSMYKDQKTFKNIKDTFPQMAGMKDEEIAGMTDDATLTDYAGNVALMNGIAQTLFADMSNVWKNLGEKAMPEDSGKAFDPSFMQALNGKFTATTNQAPKITEDQRNAVKDQSALLTKKAVIQFKVDSDEFVDKDAAYKVLGEFVNIAKLMNNTVIQVEGNTSSDGDAALNKDLSAKRAKAIATYLKYQGIDPSRFVVVGNGSDKPVGDNNTQAGKEANRRTEVFFKTVK